MTANLHILTPQKTDLVIIINKNNNNKSRVKRGPQHLCSTPKLSGKEASISIGNHTLRPSGGVWNLSLGPDPHCKGVWILEEASVLQPGSGSHLSLEQRCLDPPVYSLHCLVLEHHQHVSRSREPLGLSCGQAHS